MGKQGRQSKNRTASALCPALLLLMLFFAPLTLQAEENKTVMLYTYHLKAPYVINIEKEQGFYFDVARYLSSKSSSYTFKTRFLPRKRLNSLLAEGKLNGMVVGVAPHWFKDKSQRKYFWTRPLVQDRDEVVSLKSKRFYYRGPKSMIGLKLGGVLGFYYAGLGKLVTAGKITRLDTGSEFQNLRKLRAKRLDIIIISKPTYLHYIRLNNWKNIFFISPRPHDRFQRRILIPRNSGNSKVRKELRKILGQMQRDSKWRKIKKRYF